MITNMRSVKKIKRTFSFFNIGVIFIELLILEKAKLEHPCSFNVLQHNSSRYTGFSGTSKIRHICLNCQRDKQLRNAFCHFTTLTQISILLLFKINHTKSRSPASCTEQKQHNCSSWVLILRAFTSRRIKILIKHFSAFFFWFTDPQDIASGGKGLYRAKINNRLRGI